MNAILTNPLTYIKHQSWGTHHQGRIYETAVTIFRTGGPVAFLRGVRPTLIRDVVWGGTFHLLRSQWLPQARHHVSISQPSIFWGFFDNALAATTATIISSPFNYARNLQYGAEKNVLSTQVLLKDLWREACRAPEGIVSHLHKRLFFGWGSVRVGVGMGFSAQVYELCAGKSK
eukprot:c4428_g1_i1.p1 GENE.c4428_g1_i1~~c4428_g1_i1.p1  ORF type:complete len:174 (+),score=19.18 c4428_g1_i1:414-935(+)